MLVLSRTLTRRDKISNSNSVSQNEWTNQYEQFKQSRPPANWFFDPNGQMVIPQRFVSANEGRPSTKRPLSNFTPRTIATNDIGLGLRPTNIQQITWKYVFFQEKESGEADQFLEMKHCVGMGSSGLWKGLTRPLMSPANTTTQEELVGYGRV